MEEKREYTVTEIAEIAGVHRNTIIQYVKKGQLKARMFFDRYLIKEDDMRDFLSKKGVEIQS